MPTDIPVDVKSQLVKLGERLTLRSDRKTMVDRYYDGKSPMPPAVEQARVTKAYRLLMPVSEAPWGSLVVDSTQDRLEPSGIRSEDPAADKEVWGIWQDNQMDAESKIAQNSTLINGRSFALIWRSSDDPFPKISLDDSGTMIIQYEEGSRRKRVAALRRWVDDEDYPLATLYRPDGIYKFRGAKGSSGRGGTQWEQRMEDGDEDWPVPNPWNIVPVVELPINRRLRPGTFGYARGEYENCTGLIDRINLLTFLGLVVAFWMGFPLRGTIGEKLQRRILTDDNGEPLLDDDGKKKVEIKPPFDSMASGQFALENPDAKVAEFKAADRSNLSVFAELDQLAMITKTPRHYFPMAGGLSNLSADAIRASEGALHAKVTNHKASIGEGWEEVLRVAGLMAENSVELSPRASLVWMDHESRSLAERADAATKLKDLLPWQVIAEKVLNSTQDEINRWAAMKSSDTIGALAAAATAPAVVVPTPTPVSPAAGNGSAG